MDFYDKLVDRCQDLSKESYCHQGKGLIITGTSERKCLREYDAVTLTMSNLNVPHFMVQKQLSCPKNLCAMNLPNLTPFSGIFLYL